MSTPLHRIPRHTSGLVTALLPAILVGSPVRAAVLFTTLDGSGGFDHTARNTAAAAGQSLTFHYGIRTATKFSVIGGPYVLGSVSLPIESNVSTPTPSPVPLCVLLRRDNAGMPGEVIEELFCTATWPFQGTLLTKLTSSSHPRLVEGYYWIETALTSFPAMNEWTRYDWYSNSLGAPLLVAIDNTPWYGPPPPSWEDISGALLDFRYQPRALLVEGFPADGVGVDPASGVRTELALPNPTPFRQGTVLEYSLATTGPIEIGVFSVTGARVRTLASGEHAAGRDRAAWDGRDERGQIAPAGVYIVRLEAAASRVQRRLIKLP